MANYKRLLLVLALLGASACGGGPFIPLVGPLAGTFTVNAVDVGTFTFTTGGGLIGGTGTLTHNAQDVAVSISAIYNGAQIGGTVSNASLGSGTFTGQFNTVKSASGTFSYTDVGQISTTSGTWAARVP